MKLKLFKQTFVVQPEETVVSVESDIPYEWVDIPYKDSTAYEDYFVIGMYVINNVLHLTLVKK